jgi:DNA helicase-2/ATP-dependent DNA helicase PcrA
MRRNKGKPSDFAVMYRTNAQSRLLEEASARGHQLPLGRRSAVLWQREVKDMIAYLRLIYNPRTKSA